MIVCTLIVCSVWVVMSRVFSEDNQDAMNDYEQYDVVTDGEMTLIKEDYVACPDLKEELSDEYDVITNGDITLIKEDYVPDYVQ